MGDLMLVLVVDVVGVLLLEWVIVVDELNICGVLLL